MMHDAQILGSSELHLIVGPCVGQSQTKSWKVEMLRIGCGTEINKFSKGNGIVDEAGEGTLVPPLKNSLGKYKNASNLFIVTNLAQHSPSLGDHSDGTRFVFFHKSRQVVSRSNTIDHQVLCTSAVQSALPFGILILIVNTSNKLIPPVLITDSGSTACTSRSLGGSPAMRAGRPYALRITRGPCALRCPSFVIQMCTQRNVGSPRFFLVIMGPSFGK